MARAERAVTYIRNSLTFGLGAVVANCAPSSVSPDGAPTIVGELTLATYQGQTLPVTLMEIPNRYGQPTGCFEMLTGGSLGLAGATHTFVLAAHRRDSCGFTSFGDDVIATGKYSQEGWRLHFIADAGEHKAYFEGVIDSKSLTLNGAVTGYAFTWR